MENNNARKRLTAAFAVMLSIIAIGTFGFWSLGNYHSSLIDCFYMTVITITTIGYGEVLAVSATPHGRLFTIFIALSGIGTFTFILTYFTALLVSGEFFRGWRHYMTARKAKTMKNHYIICGSGEIGFQIAEELLVTQRDFIIVDISDSGARRYLGQDVNFLTGDATNESTLNEAGIASAAGVFAVTGDDNLNLVIVFTARQMRPDLRIVAKCRDIKHLDKLQKAGADSVISPYLIGGLRMVSEMVRPAVVSFLDMMLRERDNNYRIEEIVAGQGAAGSSVGSLKVSRGAHALLLALRREDVWHYNPADGEIIRENDVLVFLATPEGRIRLEATLAGERE